MSVSPLQPLSVDCSLEYELDMSMFPGWDDPTARAQPAVMLHRPDTCICQPVSHVTLESYDNEDDLSIANADFYEIFNDLPCEESSCQLSPALVHTSTQTQEELLSVGRTLTELLCDPYIIGAVTPSPLYPVYTSSILSSCTSPSSALSDIDFLLLSPADTLQHPSLCRKRKHDDPEDSSSSKRPRYYGDELFSELNLTFYRHTETKVSELDSDNEMGYDFNTPIRD